MPQRQLYLAAYDVASPSRARKLRHLVRGHATAGQYSAFECWMTEREARSLHVAAEALLDADADRFFMLRLDPRCGFRAIGKAELPKLQECIYIG